MKETYRRNKKSKLCLYSKIVLGTLALVVIVGLSSAAYAASDNTDNNTTSSQMGLFNPFTLMTITPVTESSPGTVISSSAIMQPPILIPFRSPPRSPFRPPWVPGPPPWPPGPPPWPPGPPPWPPGPQG